MATKFSPKMYNVASGNLNKIGWQFDEERKAGVMRVEFRNGTEYDYYPVKKEKFSEVFNQDISVGTWFSQEIKNNPEINYEKVGH